jgi:hypothetical protein
MLLGAGQRQTDESHERALSYGENTYDSAGANSVLGGKTFIPLKNAANFSINSFQQNQPQTKTARELSVGNQKNQFGNFGAGIQANAYLGH